MKETSKAMRRRLYDNEFPWVTDIFHGEVLDVGSGDDPLKSTREYNVTPFDLPDGGGDDLTKFFPPSKKFDVIHGSQVLEHAIDPKVMLGSWLECLKPGGYIVFTTPDYITYEGAMYPSRWNAGHRSSWSLSETESKFPIHCKLPEWLDQFDVQVLLCRLVLSNYDKNIGTSIDQTLSFEKGVECFLEVVLQKK